MKITNKSPNMIVFDKLSCGEVFKDEHSNICMKIEETVNGCNMVYLSNGSLDCIEIDKKVERVRCELVIDN